MLPKQAAHVFAGGVLTPDLPPSCVLIDTGASESVGSLQAVSDLANAACEKFGRSGFLPYRKEFPDFTVANGMKIKPMVGWTIPTSYEAFFVYGIPSAVRAPILMSIKSLRALNARLGLSKDLMVFRPPETGKEHPTKLFRTEHGHLIFNLIADIFVP